MARRRATWPAAVKPRESGSDDARIALLVAWVLVLVILFQGVVSMLTQTTEELTPVARGLGILASVVAAALFIQVQTRTIRQRAVATWIPWTIVAAATVGFAVGAWLNAALALGIFALVLTARWLAVVTALYCVAIGLFILTQGVRPINALFYLLVVLAISLLLYALTRLALAVGELLVAREAVARLRVDEERHRISRDLHDILGRSLVAISLRVQTALRLMPPNAERCAAQLDEVAKLVAASQNELRALTRGASVVGLDDELQTAADLFGRLGIRFSTELSEHSAADGPVDKLAGRIVRECVTNALKHAKPSRVEISRREESATTVLVIMNDGAERIEHATEGSGLSDLAARVENGGGTLEAAHLSRGWFRVIARLPHVSTQPAQSAGDSSSGPDDRLMGVDP